MYAESEDEILSLRSELNIHDSEQIISVDYFHFEVPRRHISAAKAIMRLTTSPNLYEIGRHGPSVAANALSDSESAEHKRLYDVFFTRDAHVVADFLFDRFPELMRATVLETLRHTGVIDKLYSDGLQDEQEHGKPPHEVRDPRTDLIARRLIQEKNWGFPHYGAVDTAGKNIKGIVTIASLDPSFLDERYEAIDGSRPTVLDGLLSHVAWLRRRMDLNPEGLVESLFINKLHHANQSWEDSPEPFHHADGSWARHHPDKGWGVASFEVQAEVYEALQGTIRLFKTLISEDAELATVLIPEVVDLEIRVRQLRLALLEKFWVEDDSKYGGYFARGSDRDEAGNLHLLRIRSAGMGHALNTSLLDGDHPEIVRKREAVIRNLFSEEMLCPSGFRTLASDEVRYAPERYHNGNSWPWVTYFIAKGLERHGYHLLAEEAKRRVFSVYLQTRILPEYTTGFADAERRLVDRRVEVFDPTIMPEPISGFSRYQICQPPQEIQAWTAAAILAMKYERAKTVFNKDRPSDQLMANASPLELQILQAIARNIY